MTLVSTKECAIEFLSAINNEKLIDRAYSLIQYLWLKDDTASFPFIEERSVHDEGNKQSQS
ncbi:MAG: hypothetical protein K2M82_04465 [Lachnospiraceae bacterium]|nr:hypothetical protein [Lachnospiraceae bacterium]